jgi:hypothetical protein
LRAVWPDESLDSITSAIASTYRRSPSGGGIPEASDILRVDEAVAAAVHARTSHCRTVVGPFIGEDHVIKSMNEFEALRFMRAENLAAEQVTAFKVMRQAVGMDAPGESVCRSGAATRRQRRVVFPSQSTVCPTRPKATGRGTGRLEAAPPCENRSVGEEEFSPQSFTEGHRVETG